MSRKILGMRTRVGIAALAFGVAASLIGCSSSSAPEEPAETPDTETAETEEVEASDLSGDLTIFAAASLETAFVELGGSFMEENPGVNISFTFDGSSGLATQIIGGAPVDVFASADEPNMLKITDEGLNEREPIAFATSELAIAVAPGNPFGIEALADLVEAGPDGAAPITVICAVEVPCGNASNTLLERDGVDLVPASEEQNVTAVLTKVREGEADAGLVYMSDILRAHGEVEGISIENAGDAAGDYLIVPLAGSASPEAALGFSEYLVGSDAQALFADLGFGPAR